MVSFKKGVSSRCYYNETLDLLSKELIKAVLSTAFNDDDGHGREILKPMNLSKTSPRIFWSIVHHYGPDIPAAMKVIFPDVEDWTWLSERKRELSEKALLNQIAKEEEEDKKKLAKNNKKSKKNSKEEVIISINEENNIDIDIIEDNTYHNELISLFANDNIDDIVPLQWRTSIQDQMQSSQAYVLASTIGYNTINNSHLFDKLLIESQLLSKPSYELLDSWRSSAQSLVVKSFWRIICGGSVRIYHVIRKMGIKTPKSLLLWMKAPEGLYNALLKLDSNICNINLKKGINNSSSSSSSSSKTTNFIFNIDWLIWCFHIATAFVNLEHWTSVYNYDDDDDDDDDDEDDDNIDENDNQGWLNNVNDNFYINKRVKIIMDYEFWEEGTVSGYLPPDDDEPMSLWKVKLDNTCIYLKDRFEDLEENELLEALI
jgi:hypothetical protein